MAFLFRAMTQPPEPCSATGTDIKLKTWGKRTVQLIVWTSLQIRYPDRSRSGFWAIMLASWPQSQGERLQSPSMRIGSCSVGEGTQQRTLSFEELGGGAEDPLPVLRGILV